MTRPARKTRTPRARTQPDPAPHEGVITAVAPSGRDAARWLVKVGRQVIARLDQRQIESLALAPGVALTPELAARIDDAASLWSALEDAKRILTRRAMSRGRLIERLTRRGHERTPASAAADEAIRLGLLDETEYAAAVVRSLLEAKPAGRALLIARLRQRRVAPDVAQTVVDAALEGVDQHAGARALATRRLRSMPAGLPPEKVKSRLYGHMARRGFPPDVCAEVVRAALRGRGDAED